MACLNVETNPTKTVTSDLAVAIQFAAFSLLSEMQKEKRID